MGQLTYGAELGWEKSTAKKWTERRQKLGEEEFNRRIRLANQMYNEEIERIKQNKRKAGQPVQVTEDEIAQLKKQIELQIFGK